MAVARVSEISATSPQSFEDAIRQGLERATKTLRGVTAAWVKERPIIKTAVIECEPVIDARAIRFLKKLGFSRESANLVYVK